MNREFCVFLLSFLGESSHQFYTNIQTMFYTLENFSLHCHFNSQEDRKLLEVTEYFNISRYKAYIPKEQAYTWSWEHWF